MQSNPVRVRPLARLLPLCVLALTGCVAPQPAEPAGPDYNTLAGWEQYDALNKKLTYIEESTPNDRDTIRATLNDFLAEYKQACYPRLPDYQQTDMDKLTDGWGDGSTIMKAQGYIQFRNSARSLRKTVVAFCEDVRPTS